MKKIQLKCVMDHITLKKLMKIVVFMMILIKFVKRKKTL